MPPAARSAQQRSFALRFISGKYRGDEISLSPGDEVILGRASDVDVVLVEDMVSRRHARIGYDDGGLNVMDLGSTNGTFVNGEKIQGATPLTEGDRVLVGTNILRVLTEEGSGPRKKQDEPAASTGMTRTMAGSIAEIPLPDLLQLLGTSKKSGVLVVRSEADVGYVHLRRGDIVYAQIGDDAALPALKAIFRIIAWNTGSFELGQAEEFPTPPQEREISVTVQEVLMEGMRQMDELAALQDQLPDLEAQLSLARPLHTSFSRLNEDELEVLRLAHNLGDLASVLNATPLMDLDAAKVVLRLLREGFLHVAS